MCRFFSKVWPKPRLVPIWAYVEAMCMQDCWPVPFWLWLLVSMDRLNDFEIQVPDAK